MPLILQNRDLVIFRELGNYGFLSLSQVARLAFDGNSETTRKRVVKLAVARLVTIEKIPFSNLKIVRLTKLAADEMEKLGLNVLRLPKAIGHSCLHHDLAIRDVIISFNLAFNQHHNIV